MTGIRVGIITISDRSYRSKREDLSGPAIKVYVENFHLVLADYLIVPDEVPKIVKAVNSLSKISDLILTTGGTGLSPRDVTPEAMDKLIEKELPGISEAIRAVSFQKTPMGILSRGKAGVYNNTLIVNLPGSPKAVREILDSIFIALIHGVEVLKGVGKHFGG